VPSLTGWTGAASCCWRRSGWSPPPPGWRWPQTINQTVTPDHLRGRMSAVFSLVVTGGPRLGDVESGSVAGAAGVRFSVVSGGVLCLLGVLGIVLAFPALARYDSDDWIAREPAPAVQLS
jgi:transmembrane secretion effector